MRPSSSPLPNQRPRLTVVALCLVEALAGAAHANPSAPVPDADDPTIAYTVTRRDTLIGLNRALIDKPGAWREIARLNHLPDANRIAAGQTLRLPLRLLRSHNVAAQLISSFGDVRVADRAASVGALLNVGDTIRTGDASTAVVQLADGSHIKLAPDTEGRLDEQRRFRVKATSAAVDDGLVAATLRLISGSIEVIATKVLRARPLEISTPTAVIGVRGTQYRVRNDVTPASATSAAANVSATEVLEGKVHAQVGSAAAQAVDVPADFGAPLEAGKTPLVLPLPLPPDLAGLPQSFDRPAGDTPLRLPVAGDTRLRVQIADDPAFDHIAVDLHVAAGDDARIAPLAIGRWYLRARRISDAGLEGLDARRTFDVRAPIERTLLLEPAAGAERRVGDVTLRWTPDVQFARYAVEVARDAGFTQLVVQTDDVATPQFVFHPTGTAWGAADGVYFWRVVGVHADGHRDAWGDSQAFVLRPTPRAPLARMSPDGSVVELIWEGSPTDRVQVELASDAAYRDVVARGEFTAPRGGLARPRPGTYHAHYRFVEPNGFTTAWSGDVEIKVESNWHQGWRAWFGGGAD